MKKFLLTSLAVAAFAVSSFAAESGLSKGEQVSPFHPQHVAGPLANSDKCFPCTFQNRPQVQVWVNTDSKDNVMMIAKNLDQMMSKYDKKEFKALIVFLTDASKVAETKTMLMKGVSDAKLKHVGVAVLAKNHEAVESYKINTASDIKNTVFVYKNWKVTDKMVNLKGDASGLAALDKAIAAITN